MSKCRPFQAALLHAGISPTTVPRARPASTSIVARIPGIQIVNYMIQLTLKDFTLPFEGAKPEDLLPEDMNAKAT